MLKLEFTHRKTATSQKDVILHLNMPLYEHDLPQVAEEIYKELGEHVRMDCKYGSIRMGEGKKWLETKSIIVEHNYLESPRALPKHKITKEIERFLAPIIRKEVVNYDKVHNRRY